jgi:hypothetical protein
MRNVDASGFNNRAGKWSGGGQRCRGRVRIDQSRGTPKELIYIHTYPGICSNLNI